MDPSYKTLPIIESCDGCGACCEVVTRPPFYRVFDETGEEAWERLRRERPDLLAELLADYRTSLTDGGPFYGTPCLWLDKVTRRCLHYDYRPLACSEFPIGEEDCIDARRRAHID